MSLNQNSWLIFHMSPPSPKCVCSHTELNANISMTKAASCFIYLLILLMISYDLTVILTL